MFSFILPLILTAATMTPVGDADDKVIASQMPSYPLTTCLMSDEPLGDDAVSLVHEGRLARFCCKMCAKDFVADPAASLAKLDRAVIAAQKAHYPMKTCMIGGKPLGDGSLDYVHGTMLVRFCCKMCVGDFESEPDKYMRPLKQAYIDVQKDAYPLATCVVSDEVLGDDAKDILYGTRLVRFCCNGCVKDFKADPGPYLAKVDAAWAAVGHERAKAHDGDDGHDHGDHDGHDHGDHGVDGDDGDHDGHDHDG
mgnify:FL=1